MFNFQKEIVINNPDLIEVIAKGDTDGKSPLGIKLRINGGEADYFVKYIDGAKIYKTKPVDPVCGTVAIDLTEAAAQMPAGGHVQIRLELGLDGEYRGDFGSALYYFRKPILIDIDKFDAANLKAAFNKVAISCEKLFEIVEPVAENKKITIKFADAVIKLRHGEIVVLGGGELDEVVKTYALKETGRCLGVGTYEYVLHNLRMPTSANYRFTSTSAEEMPIKGQKYTQYSFSYTVPRPGLGGVSAAGQAIHSTTVHTLYVAAGDNGCDDKFTANESGLTIEAIAAETYAKELPSNYLASEGVAAAAAVDTNGE